MTALTSLLSTAAQTLRDQGVPFALVGGLAVSARVEPRFTRDVDLVIDVGDDAGAETVVRALSSHLRPIEVFEHEVLQRMSMVRMASLHRGDEHTQPVIDLLFATSGIEAEVVAAADPVEVLPGVIVPLATIGHLVALKLLSTDADRPQDAWDLRGLLNAASPADLAQAREALHLIEGRGADRDRPLRRMLDDLL